MACGHCAGEAREFRVPNNITGQLDSVFECRDCKRRLVSTTRGLRWQPQAGYCPDCKAETWRFVVHPRYEHRIALWPDPASLTARYWTPSGWAIHGAFCADCCPDFGAAACAHILGADPEAGSVIGHDRSRDRYTDWYTAEYGAFLTAWLDDELRLDEADRLALIRQWEHDRDAANARPTPAEEERPAPRHEERDDDRRDGHESREHAHRD